MAEVVTFFIPCFQVFPRLVASDSLTSGFQVWLKRDLVGGEMEVGGGSDKSLLP